MKAILIDDNIGTMLLLGMILPQHIEATTLLIAKGALEIITAKVLLAIDIRIATLTQLAGDPYIHEEHT